MYKFVIQRTLAYFRSNAYLEWPRVSFPPSLSLGPIYDRDWGLKIKALKR